MAFQVTNFGVTRKFPVRGMMVDLTQMQTIEMDDGDLAQELSRFPMIHVEEVSHLDRMPKPQLIKLAKERGIDNPFFKTRKELLEELEA